MYTECPSCHTYFKVTSAQLKVADGKVRCGSCNEVFNALESLVDIVPPLDKGEKQPASSDARGVVESSDIISSPAENDAEELTNGPASSSAAEVSAGETNFEASGKAESDSSTASSDIEGLLAEGDSALDKLIEEPSVAEATAEVAGGQDEINKDIDDALNDLFNEDELNSEQRKKKQDDTAVPTDGLMSELSAFGNSEIKIDSVGDLSSGIEFDNQHSSFDTSEPADKSVSKFGTSLPDSTLGSESDQAAPNSQDFDLGESILASEPASEQKKQWDNTSSILPPEEEKKSSEEYILNELQEHAGEPNTLASKIGWVSLIVFLLCVLLVQFAYLKRSELVKYPSLKPALEVMCSALNVVMSCDIPVPRDTSAIELVDRNVVSHPSAKNALLITSVIKNNAEFTQPYPQLILTFSDINQKVIARRTFVPTEYLGKEVDISRGMPSSIPTKIVLEIVDPGQNAVNFEFDFQ